MAELLITGRLNQTVWRNKRRSVASLGHNTSIKGWHSQVTMNYSWRRNLGDWHTWLSFFFEVTVIRVIVICCIFCIFFSFITDVLSSLTLALGIVSCCSVASGIWISRFMVVLVLGWSDIKWFHLKVQIQINRLSGNVNCVDVKNLIIY